LSFDKPNGTFKFGKHIIWKLTLYGEIFGRSKDITLDNRGYAGRYIFDKGLKAEWIRTNIENHRIEGAFILLDDKFIVVS